MAKPRVCVLRAPGTNCDGETTWAFETAGAEAERLHVFRVLESPDVLDRYQILCVPGGFSYGDDIGAGVVFSRQLAVRLGGALGDFLKRDTLTLGICNGFQVLLKAGVLPSGTDSWPPPEVPPATLTWNENGRYTALWTRLRVDAPQNVFLRGLDELDLPIAHAEGRVAVRDESVLTDWADRGQVALRYTMRDGKGDADSAVKLPYPENPNGSVANVAGVGDPTGRVLGLMPHPERFLHATQHPRWTRLGLTGEGDGMRLFRNAVEYFR